MKQTKINLLFSMFLAGAMLGAPMLPTVVMAHDHDETTEEIITSPTALDPETEVLKINGETVTMGLLQAMAFTRPVPGMQVDAYTDVPLLRGDALVKLGKGIGAWELLAAEARENGTEVDEAGQEQIDRLVDRHANALLYRQIVTEKLTEPTDEELHAIYDREREKSFKQLEELKMRHIFVSTYVPYTVKDGDTLESIAKEIGGDEALADRILSDDTKKPRIESTEMPAAKDGEAAKEESEPLPPKALTIGEKLMVPAEGEKGSEAREKIDAAYEELESGTSFEDVAKEYSENENPGRMWVIRPEQQEREIMSELSEAFMSLEDGAYSEPIRTKHGFQIVQRVSYTEKGYQDFDEVEGTLANIFAREQNEKLVTDFFLSALSNPNVAKFNEAEIAKAEDERDNTAVLLTIGDQEWTADRFKSEVRSGLDLSAGMDKIKATLAKARTIQAPLVAEYMKVEGIFDNPEVIKVRAAAEDTILAQQYLGKISEEGAEAPTDEAIEKLYNETIQRYRQPETFEVRAAIVPVAAAGGEEEAKAALSTALKDVTTLADFETAVENTFKKEYPKADYTRKTGSLQAPSLANTTAEILRNVSAPGMTEPVIENDQAIVWWVESVKEESTKPLDEVKPEIESMLARQNQQTFAQEKIEGLVEESQAELLYED